MTTGTAAHTAPLCDAARPVGPGAARDALPSQLLRSAGPVGAGGVTTSPARHFDSVAGNVGDGPETRRQRAEAAAAAAEARAAQARRAVGQIFDRVFGVDVPPLDMEPEHVHEVERDYRLRRAAYVGVPRAVVEQMMQQEAMRVRLHGQPAAEPPYADFFAWAGQQPAAARGGGGG
jgi:hypothetical protein